MTRTATTQGSRETTAGAVPGLSVAVAGAGGLVGAELVQILSDRPGPVGDVRLWGATETVGMVLPFRDTHIVVRPATGADWSGIAVVVLAVPATAAVGYIACARERGVTVVDLSATSRQEVDAPLVVHAVNPQDLAEHTGVIACPGGFTLPLALLIQTLARIAPVSEVDIVGLVAAVAAGRAGVAELSQQVFSLLRQQSTTVALFPAVLAFDTLPWVGDPASPRPAGDTDAASPAEVATVAELRRVLGKAAPPQIALTLSYVSVFAGHSAAVRVRLDSSCDRDRVRTELAETPGFRMVPADADDAPVPQAAHAVEDDKVLIGRVRVTPVGDATEVRLWLTFDPVRQAAQNVVAILETLAVEALV